MHPLLDYEVRRLRSATISAMARVRTARTLRDIVRELHVPVPPLLRGVHLREPACAQLDQLAQQKARELINAQLGELAQIVDPQTRKQRLGRLESQEWVVLRGHLPNVLLWAQREAAKLQHRLTTPPANTND